MIILLHNHLAARSSFRQERQRPLEVHLQAAILYHLAPLLTTHDVRHAFRCLLYSQILIRGIFSLELGRGLVGLILF